MKRLKNILKRISVMLLIVAMISASSFVGFGTKTVIAATSGPLYPGTVTSGSALLGYGGALTSPNNVKVSDNIYATGFDSQLSLDTQNFGFSIPTGSTINGILVEVEKKTTNDGGGTFDVYAKIIKANGTLGSTNKTAVAWTTSDAFASYGGSSDLWGETWTAEDINDADFGFAFACRPFEDTASIDSIRITVTYTAGGGGGSSSPTLIIDKIQSTQTRKINSIDYSTIKRINLITSN